MLQPFMPYMYLCIRVYIIRIEHYMLKFSIHQNSEKKGSNHKSFLNKKRLRESVFRSTVCHKYNLQYGRYHKRARNLEKLFNVTMPELLKIPPPSLIYVNVRLIYVNIYNIFMLTCNIGLNEVA